MYQEGDFSASKVVHICENLKYFFLLSFKWSKLEKLYGSIIISYKDSPGI